MPYTKYIPKPLLKISQNTIIHDLILNSINQGFYNFIISINYKAEKFKKTFDDGRQLNCNIKYLQEKSLGTAGPIKLLKKKDFKKKPIIIMNADLITNIDLKELLNFHNQNRNDLTVCVKNFTLSIPFGEIEFNKKGINKIYEKPNKTYFINIGIYAISQSILKVLKKKEFLDMNSLINLAIQKITKVKAFPVYENWQDVGNKFDFNKLRKKLMLNAAIIGFGDIGYYLSKDKKRKQTWSHFEAYELIDKIELRAIVEINQKKIDFIKKNYPQIFVFQNIEKLINSNLNIDIISICTPTKTHFKILNKSLKLKPKIIICEKPICSSVNEAKKNNQNI